MSGRTLGYHSLSRAVLTCTSHRTPAAGVPPSMHAPRGTPAIWRASGRGSDLKNERQHDRVGFENRIQFENFEFQRPAGTLRP
jgi:hypothetical protein